MIEETGSYVPLYTTCPNFSDGDCELDDAPCKPSSCEIFANMVKAIHLEEDDG